MGTSKKSEMNPDWWTTKHTRAWDRVKDAFARDWEQTKADFSKDSGHELNQNVADTVKQATGKERIPDPMQANDKPNDEYQRVEPALRFGYGASRYYDEHKQWNESLEAKMRADWDHVHADQKFDKVKEDVRRGWERARKL